MADSGTGDLTWNNGIHVIFAPYAQCMLRATRGAIDLDQYTNVNGTGVKDNIEAIKRSIGGGTMPANGGGG